MVCAWKDAVRFLAILVALGSWAISGLVLAADIDTVADSEPFSTLEEIVVTAQRRTEDGRNSSLCLQVLSVDALDKAGIADVIGLTTQVPGLQIAPVGALSVFFRESGNYNSNSLGGSAIAVPETSANKQYFFAATRTFNLGDAAFP